jgi:hypothetical protein
MYIYIYSQIHNSEGDIDSLHNIKIVIFTTLDAWDNVAFGHHEKCSLLWNTALLWKEKDKCSCCEKTLPFSLQVFTGYHIIRY